MYILRKNCQRLVVQAPIVLKANISFELILNEPPSKGSHWVSSGVSRAAKFQYFGRRSYIRAPAPRRGSIRVRMRNDGRARAASQSMPRDAPGSMASRYVCTRVYVRALHPGNPAFTRTRTAKNRTRSYRISRLGACIRTCTRRTLDQLN